MFSNMPVSAHCVAGRTFYSCVHCSQNVKVFSRAHMEAMCTKLNTHNCVGKEMCVGPHVDLNVDVHLDVSSSLSSLFTRVFCCDA